MCSCCCFKVLVSLCLCPLQPGRVVTLVEDPEVRHTPPKLNGTINYFVIELQLTTNFIVYYFANYSLGLIVSSIVFIFKMSESSEKRPSCFPRAQGDIFRCLTLADRHTKTQFSQFTMI